MPHTYIKPSFHYDVVIIGAGAAGLMCAAYAAESNKSVLLAGIFISFLLGIIGGFRYSFFARYFKLNPSPNFITSTKSYFISSSLNLLLPSKLGDLTKGFICSKIDKINYNKSLLITLYMKN